MYNNIETTNMLAPGRTLETNGPILVPHETRCPGASSTRSHSPQIPAASCQQSNSRQQALCQVQAQVPQTPSVIC